MLADRTVAAIPARPTHELYTCQVCCSHHDMRPRILPYAFHTNQTTTGRRLMDTDSSYTFQCVSLLTLGKQPLPTEYRFSFCSSQRNFQKAQKSLWPKKADQNHGAATQSRQSTRMFSPSSRPMMKVSRDKNKTNFLILLLVICQPY